MDSIMDVNGSPITGVSIRIMFDILFKPNK